MKGSEMAKKMNRIGCYKIREGGNHEIWYSPVTDMEFPFPRHYNQELKKGLENKIRKLSGLDHS